MGMFCRYALNSFPGRATLDNLYALQFRTDVPIRIHHRDKKRRPKEIDLIISKDGTIYPTEFKKSATLDRKNARSKGRYQKNMDAS